jgi:hypothetical protein
MLVVAALPIAAGVRDDIDDVAAAAERRWTAILTGALGLLYVFLGSAALGLAGVLGIVGGLVVVALAVTEGGRRPRIAVALLAIATLPFAALTWWSVVTPLIALLTLALGVPLLRGSR